VVDRVDLLLTISVSDDGDTDYSLGGHVFFNFGSICGGCVSCAFGVCGAWRLLLVFLSSSKF
jgi:hypothetical protein